MTYRCFAVPLVCCLAATLSTSARAQGGVSTTLAPGTFEGRDSLDARKASAPSSRVRSHMVGTATWAIELDSLDLRRKFTMRLELPAPTPVTVVMRAVDSLPPAPGRYTMMIPSSGASHQSRKTMHADVYTREGARNQTYSPMVTSLVIASISMNGGQPLVTGHLDMRSGRYADRKPGEVVLDYVWLHIAGQFAARAASNVYPQIVVTPAMQEAVLDRALLGFMITNMGASNGDGDADSTQETTLARQFLESRWRHAAVIERLDVDGMLYNLRLRGRLAPVVCELSSRRERSECTTLPAPVSTHGSPARLSGRVDLKLAPSSGRTDATTVVVHLLPYPAPLKDAYAKWCDGWERADSIAITPFDLKMSAARGGAEREAAEREFTAVFEKRTAMYVAEYRALFASFAVQHASVGTDGRYAFASVPPGHYLLLSALSAKDRIEWYHPVVVGGGSEMTRDLDAANMNKRGWACGTPLPFLAVHERP